MGYTIFMNIAAKKFSRPREDGLAGGGWGEECRVVRALRRAKQGGYVRFRFLDLCIIFGKIISKVCCCFLSGARKFKFVFRSFFKNPDVELELFLKIIMSSGAG